MEFPLDCAAGFVSKQLNVKIRYRTYSFNYLIAQSTSYLLCVSQQCLPDLQTSEGPFVEEIAQD